MTMFYTPNPIIENALREADASIFRATALLEGIEMQWSRSSDMHEDCWRLQDLLKNVRDLGGSDGPTEVVNRTRISELESVIAAIEAWGKPVVLDRIGAPLKQALSILTECANQVGVSDTG